MPSGPRRAAIPAVEVICESRVPQHWDELLARVLVERRPPWNPELIGSENDELIHEAPAIVGCQTPPALANGVLFATYHLHMPWVIPTGLLDTFILSYPSKRYRSTLIGIAVHSAQSILVLGLVLALVLKG